MVNGNHILIAVSGGADSVALLHLLHESARRCRWRLTVAHLNHGIRGRAAGEDARFVEAMARRLRIPCVIGKARVPALAKRRGHSLEMAARDARYAFLARTAKAVKADMIATAHTADDQAETILLKLMRGAGRGGLSGMAGVTEWRGIPVVRPLLGMTRQGIESYLRERKLTWREDESNRDTAFLRNRVRHELLPLLERDYNPKIREALLRTGEILGAEDGWMDGMALGILDDCTLPGTTGLKVKPLHGHPLAARRRVIRLWLVRCGLPEPFLDFDTVARVDALLARRNRGSATVELRQGWRVRRQYDQIKLMPPNSSGCPQSTSIKPVRLSCPGETIVPGLGLRITTTLAPGIVKERGHGPGVLPVRATISAGALGKRALWIRLVRPGDRISPFGMKGSRKLQDILVDAKVPRAERARIPVLECDGEVVWMPGYRIARAWAVSDGTRNNIQLMLTV